MVKNFSARLPYVVVGHEPSTFTICSCWTWIFHIFHM